MWLREGSSGDQAFSHGPEAIGSIVITKHCVVGLIQITLYILSVRYGADIEPCRQSEGLYMCILPNTRAIFFTRVVVLLKWFSIVCVIPLYFKRRSL